MCPPPSLPLIIRSDDAGAFPEVNEAIERCLDAGLVKNVSVMVPGPAFDDAVSRLAGRDDICLGLHITLNAEFMTTKWGPVAPRGQVASLVDENGRFYPTPQHTQEAGADMDEAMVEVEAQLARAREAGLKLSYIDEHMLVGRIGLRQHIQELCRREGLLDVHDVPRLSLGRTLKEAAKALDEAREAATATPRLWITHPLLPECPVLSLDGQEESRALDFAQTRVAELQLLTGSGLPRLLHEQNAVSVRYTDVLPAA